MFERRPEEDFEVGQLVSWVDTHGNVYPARITGLQGPLVRSTSDEADGATRTFSWHGGGWVCGCMTLKFGHIDVGPSDRNLPDGYRVGPARPNVEQWGLELARVVATRSPCVRRQVGAVLIKDARIVGHGYNGPPRGLPHRCSEPGPNQCVRIGQAPGSSGAACCVHAEANALMFSDRGDARGAVLYCTHSPCLACAQMIINAGVVGVVSASEYPDEAGRAELLRAGVSFSNRGAPKK